MWPPVSVVGPLSGTQIVLILVIILTDRHVAARGLRRQAGRAMVKQRDAQMCSASRISIVYDAPTGAGERGEAERVVADVRAYTPENRALDAPPLGKRHADERIEMTLVHLALPRDGRVWVEEQLPAAERPGRVALPAQRGRASLPLGRTLQARAVEYRVDDAPVERRALTAADYPISLVIVIRLSQHAPWILISLVRPCLETSASAALPGSSRARTRRSVRMRLRRAVSPPHS